MSRLLPLLWSGFGACLTMAVTSDQRWMGLVLCVGAAAIVVEILHSPS